MRITGGVLTNFFVECPDGVIRPAMDRMRESVFAILGDLVGKSFLDLFSGSATIALEALSRGSRDIELCEKDKIKTKTILQNVDRATKLLKERYNLNEYLNIGDSSTPISNGNISESDKDNYDDANHWDKVVRCHFMPAEYFVKRCHRDFDIIFLDPPFPYKYGIDLIKKISDGGLLARGGILLFHHPREKHTTDVIGNFKKSDTREYGRSIVDFFG